MSRPLRIEYDGAWYHVMNRARKGKKLFSSREDYLCFYELLQETAEMFNFRISAYCFMSTHYHLLVQTPDGNLSRCMRHINGVYTQRYNIRHGCDGTLFRGRYKSILIDADSYLLQVVRYIHRNPLRANLVKKIDDFKWSSHNGYISNAKKWDWLNKEFILSLFSPVKSKQRAKYRAFIAEEDSEEISSFFLKENTPSMLGSEKFIEWVKNRFFNNKRNMEVPESINLTPGSNKITETVCRFYSIEKKDLYHVKRGQENEPRNVTIYLLRKLKGERLLEIGKKFSLIKHSSTSSVLERVRLRLKVERNFRKRLEKIEDMIHKSQTEI